MDPRILPIAERYQGMGGKFELILLFRPTINPRVYSTLKIRPVLKHISILESMTSIDTAPPAEPATADAQNVLLSIRDLLVKIDGKLENYGQRLWRLRMVAR
jgi:hypothetical protein